MQQRCFVYEFLWMRGTCDCIWLNAYYCLLCCLVVGLGLGLGLDLSGCLVVMDMHTYLCYFALSLSLSGNGMQWDNDRRMQLQFRTAAMRYSVITVLH